MVKLSHLATSFLFSADRVNINSLRWSQYSEGESISEAARLEIRGLDLAVHPFQGAFADPGGEPTRDAVPVSLNGDCNLFMDFSQL